MITVSELINKLGLQPHPEGGYFRETYRSDKTLDTNFLNEFNGGRSISTCIYFLLTAENFSAFHRIKQDEIWHFYLGFSVTLHIISKLGKYSKQIVGNDILNGEKPQVVVKGGDWFAAEIVEDNEFALVGCTVAPGFSFEDFEMADSKKLIREYPVHSEIISRLTH